MTTDKCCEKCVEAGFGEGELGCARSKCSCHSNPPPQTDDWKLSKIPTFQQGGSSLEIQKPPKTGDWRERFDEDFCIAPNNVLGDWIDAPSIKSFITQVEAEARAKGRREAVEFIRKGKWVSNHCYNRAEIDAALEAALQTSPNN